MKNLGWLRQQVVDWIEDDSEPALLDRALNVAVAQLVNDCSFSQLKKRVVVTPDDDGMFYVPARCSDILEIYPDGSNNEADFTFIGAKRIQAQPRQAGYYFRSLGSSEEPFAELFADFTSNSSTVLQNAGSSVDFSEDMIGMQFEIDGGAESYRIDSFTAGSPNQITIYPNYRWTNLSTAPCTVRPEGTEMISLYDSLGQAYTGDVAVEFVAKHPYLVNDTDRLIIPCQNTVPLEAVRFILRQTKYDVDAQRLENMYVQYRATECAKQPAKTEPNARPNDTIFSAPGRGRNSFGYGRR